MRRNGLLAVALTALIPLQSLEAFTESRAAIPVIVHLEDQVGLRHDLLREATAEVDETFRAARVRLVWTRPGVSVQDGVASCARVVRLTITEGPPPARATDALAQEALGSAAPWAGQARVFYRRLSAAAAEHPVAASRILGHVISHELGHLLLSSGRHTDLGIMRPAVDFHHIALRRFTDDQARLIRSALAPLHQETSSCGR